MSSTNQFGQTIGIPVENWVKKPMPSLKTMEGRYSILELLDINRHALPLYKALQLNNPGDTWTYLPYSPFETCDEFSSWLIKTSNLSDTVLYVILDVKTKLPIGIAGYLRINPDHGVIEVGHLHFSKQLQKTPAATEAMFLMMAYVFDELNYRRYEWKCDSLNQASRNAAERLGFQFEGIFRQANVFKDRNRDTAWYSIIDNEWPTLKIKFEKWLNPNNFNHEGKQILRLQETE